MTTNDPLDQLAGVSHLPEGWSSEKLEAAREILASTGGSGPGDSDSGSGDGDGDGSGGGDGPTGGGGSGGGDGGGFKGRRVTTCSFCGKSSREVGPMVEGPNEVYICTKCTDLCQNIFRQERRRVSSFTASLDDIPSPRSITGFLDQYVVGQEAAKRTLAVAVHSHYKRLMHAE
ncbi:MAG: ClpX C4-type zinc finger protein, partial [Planctomycetota bacterium]